MKSYDALLRSKLPREHESGFTPTRPLNGKLFLWQQQIIHWALRLGRAALFEDCGLGKGPQQLEWATQVMAHTKRPVMGLCPLAVADQMVHEGTKFGYRVKKCRTLEDFDPSVICYLNYERVHLFEHLIPDLAGVVLDESSILKNVSGSLSQKFCELFSQTPFRLCCTATPAPNDYEEFGMHAQFLGYGTRRDMLVTYFIHDSANTSEWRLKKHAQKEFWRWVATWAACISKPSDLGYPNEGYDLPPLHIDTKEINVNETEQAGEDLFRMPSMSSTAMHKEMRLTCAARAQAAAALVQQAGADPVVVWCNTDYEADALIKHIPEAIEVRGSDDMDEKERKLNLFTSAQERILITKPKLGGFGLNLQHCNRHIFVGLSYSFEQFYQAVRRGYRFGQKRPFFVTVIQAQTEAPIRKVILEKIERHNRMREEMKLAAQSLNLDQKAILKMNTKIHIETGGSWALYQGDAVRVAESLPAESVDFSIYSPPFAALYLYSSDPQDMGNCSTEADFIEQYSFLIREKLRLTRPGRISAVHCADITAQLWKDGHIGMKDLSGMIVKAHQDAGWIWHSPRITIWKDPVVEMQRTKALGLLYKQLRKDSCKSRVGNPDYVLVFRKPGEAESPVEHTPENYELDQWQKDASPVWMDIQQTDVLNNEGAREVNDERHIAPLQKEVIRRCLRLWSNSGDVVYSPFSGIGSEGYGAVATGRRFIGSELKHSYFVQAVQWLQKAEREAHSNLL